MCSCEIDSKRYKDYQMNIIEPYVIYRRRQQNVVDAHFKSSIQEVKSINPSHEESMG
jgi:hypothetical protein